VAVLDERGTDQDFPAKRYDLIFLLRRAIGGDRCGRLPQQAGSACGALAGACRARYAKRIASDPSQLLGVYGYFVLKGLLEKSRKVWFEAS